MTDRVYCRYCGEQIESCLAAARDAQKTWIRSYFLTLAAKWTRLAQDLELQDWCGSGCPLRKACGRDSAIVAAERRPALAPAAVA